MKCAGFAWGPHAWTGAGGRNEQGERMAALEELTPAR